MRVLLDAGVFKTDGEGKRQFERFMEYSGFIR